MLDQDITEQQVIKVKLLKGKKVIRSYKVRTNNFTIGTATGCTMRASGDKSIFPKHATILTEDGKLTLVASPKAKALVNEIPVERYQLKPKDTVRIGRLSFRVELAESFDSVEPRSILAQTDEEDTVEDDPPPSAEPRPSMTGSPTKKPLGIQPHDEKTADERPPFAHPRESTGPSRPYVANIDSELHHHTDAENDSAQDKAIGQPPESTPNEIEPFQPARRDNTDSQWGDNTAVKKIKTEKLDEGSYFDENDELTFTPEFNLAEALVVDQPPNRRGSRESYVAAHILRMADGELAEATTILKGQKFKSQSKDLICKLSGSKLIVKCRPEIPGNICERGRMYDLATLPLKGKFRKGSISEGTTVDLWGKDGKYRIDIYRPPKAPKRHLRNSIPSFAMLCAMAFFVHTVLGAAAVYTFPTLDAATSGAKPHSAEKGQNSKQVKSFVAKNLESQSKEHSSQEMAEIDPQISRKTVRALSNWVTSGTETKSVEKFLRLLSIGEHRLGSDSDLPHEGVKVTVKSPIEKPAYRVEPLFDEAKLSAAIDRDVVQKIVNSQLKIITDCYRDTLRQQDDFQGKMTFQLSIAASGRVNRVRGKPSNFSTKLLRLCIGEIMSYWTLERKGNRMATIDLPFRFEHRPVK